MRSSYEGNGRLSIALAMSSTSYSFTPARMASIYAPKDCGTRMRANELSIALEGPAGLQVAGADDPADGH
jgi:hypothetical protein